MGSPALRKFLTGSVAAVVFATGGSASLSASKTAGYSVAGIQNQGTEAAPSQHECEKGNRPARAERRDDRSLMWAARLAQLDRQYGSSATTVTATTAAAAQPTGDGCVLPIVDAQAPVAGSLTNNAPWASAGPTAVPRGLIIASAVASGLMLASILSDDNSRLNRRPVRS